MEFSKSTFSLIELGKRLANCVREITLIVRRIVGRRREIVCVSPAESRHCKGGHIARVQPLSSGLEINSRGGAEVDTVTSEAWVSHGIPSEEDGGSCSGFANTADTTSTIYLTRYRRVRATTATSNQHNDACQ